MGTETTSSYANLFTDLYAPEGSEMNDRLKRLQELEQMRKEREARRQEMQKQRGERTRGVITRTARVKSVTPDPETSSNYSVRRAMSVREDDNFGGARPKFSGYADDQEASTTEGWSLFSDVTATLVPRRTMQTGTDYTSSRTRQDSTDSEDSTFGTTSYSRSAYKPGSGYSSRFGWSISQPQHEKEDEVEGGSLFSSITKSILGPKSTAYEPTSYSNRVGSSRSQPMEVADYEDNAETEQAYEENGEGTQQTEEPEDEGEEPLHFIERLKNGSHSKNRTNGHGTRMGFNKNGHEYVIGTIPKVPPLRQDVSNVQDDKEMPELVQPTEDILSMAQSISSTFGQVKSPTSPQPRTGKSENDTRSQRTKSSPYSRKSAVSTSMKSPRKTSSTMKNGPNGNAANESVTYEEVEMSYDSSGDDEGKILDVNVTNVSQWVVEEQGPGDLDTMQAFFTGDSVNMDPNISRELDGEKVRAVLDKTPGKSLKKTSRQSPESKQTQNGTPKGKPKSSKKTQSPVDRVKGKSGGKKGSGSENDSRPNSESEGEAIVNKKDQSKAKSVTNGSVGKPGRSRSQSIGENLAKLESMTHEKTRKQSSGDLDVKKVVPSYMSSTSSSARKTTREKDSSPNPSPHDLKKDVRELKQFVRENSVPNTPVSTPSKSYGAAERKLTNEISVQTDDSYLTDYPYFCRHCGKASNEEVIPKLTVENLKKTTGPEKKKSGAKSTIEHKIRSKDSDKSDGELSTKSDKTHNKSSFKPKISASASYMKGTTSSRLKNSDSQKNLISPEMMLYSGDNVDSKQSKSLLKGKVSQTSKVFEAVSKEKSKPALSVFRGSSVERPNAKLGTANTSSKLGKSKSVEMVHLFRTVDKKPAKFEKDMIGNKPAKASNTSAKPTPLDLESKKELNEKQEPLNIEVPEVHSPRSPTKPKSTVSSPRSVPVSPRSASEKYAKGSPEESGQFTKLDNNPFIKNDVKRRNSLRDRDQTESVWEKVESRSRDSSLTRTASVSGGDQKSRDSSLHRSNSSAGERASLSHLSWSDSGSTGSLDKAKNTHGSNSSLADKPPSPRVRKTSTDSNSQNTMLNLLSPLATTRNPVTGALETDVDAIVVENKEKPKITEHIEHNEETVNRAHLEFAKKACHLLDTEMKRRDSSNESGDRQKGQKSEVSAVNGTNDTAEVSLNKDPKSNNKQGKKGKKGLKKFFKK